MTETDNIGVVIGMTNETMNLFDTAIVQVLLMQIRILRSSSLTQTPLQIPTGKQTQVPRSPMALILFSMQQAHPDRRNRGMPGTGVYAIGVDRDQYNDAPGTVITSAMKRVDTAVYDSVETRLTVP